MKKRGNITTILDTSPYLGAVNQFLHGVITSEEMATKVKAWADGIIKSVRAERRAILAELKGKKKKGVGK